MRFKNLTIILTLTCLSVVAFAGLVLLPISKGICASWIDTSIGSTNSKALYDNYKIDLTGRGWSLSGYLSAGPSSATASAAPSIDGLNDFTETHAWIGYANAHAKLEKCKVYRLKWWSSKYHEKITLPSKSDSSSGDLRAKVVVGTRAWARGEVKIRSNPGIKFDLDAPLGVFGGAGSEINFSGGIYVQVDDIEITGHVDTPVDVSEVQIAKVLGSSRAKKSSSINSFWFGTQSINNGEQVADDTNRENYDSTSVDYMPPPLDFIFIEGSAGWIAIPVH